MSGLHRRMAEANAATVLSMAPTAIPILPSNDFDTTVDFYGRLGFEQRALWPGDYLILAHPLGVELHFWLSSDSVEPRHAAGCYVRFTTAGEAQSLHDQWADRNLGEGRMTAFAATDYGLLEFALHDPDNNQIRFGGSTT